MYCTAISFKAVTDADTLLFGTIFSRFLLGRQEDTSAPPAAMKRNDTNK
jgi:hypothetical protein